MPESEQELHERLRAEQCLRNAHGHIAHAYAAMGEPHLTPGHRRRVVSETLDAVDWIRRALESIDRLTPDPTQVSD